MHLSLLHKLSRPFTYQGIMIPARAVIGGSDAVGFRAAPYNAMGSLTPSKFKGESEIMIANWDLTLRLFGINIAGNRPLTDVKYIELNGLLIPESAMVLKVYEPSYGFTRWHFDVSGMTIPITAGQAATLRF